jgi:hypothetical protein
MPRVEIQNMLVLCAFVSTCRSAGASMDNAGAVAARGADGMRVGSGCIQRRAIALTGVDSRKNRD